MKIETATYSRSAIIDCIKTLKQYRFYASELSSVEGLKDLEGLHNYLHQKRAARFSFPIGIRTCKTSDAPLFSELRDLKRTGCLCVWNPI